MPDPGPRPTLHARAVAMLCARALFGCSDDESAVAPSPACEPGEWKGDDGACVAPGPSLPCPPGEWERDGACVAAGIPPDGCGAGFVHDGDRGCEPVLPPVPCSEGMMAVPGETACRELAPCGS